jgi:hypothetical protein
MPSPQVGGDFDHQRLVVGQQVGGGETLPGFQRMLAQHPRAETVDGEDGGKVGFLGGGAVARPAASAVSRTPSRAARCASITARVSAASWPSSAAAGVPTSAAASASRSRMRRRAPGGGLGEGDGQHWPCAGRPRRSGG